MTRLREQGRLGFLSRGLMRAIGEALAARSRANARIQAGDKPDLLWEHPGLERLASTSATNSNCPSAAPRAGAQARHGGRDHANAALADPGQRSLSLEIAVAAFIFIEVVATRSMACWCAEAVQPFSIAASSAEARCCCARWVPPTPTRRLGQLQRHQHFREPDATGHAIQKRHRSRPLHARGVAGQGRAAQKITLGLGRASTPPASPCVTPAGSRGTCGVASARPARQALARPCWVMRSIGLHTTEGDQAKAPARPGRR